MSCERHTQWHLTVRSAGITGGFILSINDTPGAREVFGQFTMEAVPVTYTIGAAHGVGQRVGELVVSKGQIPPPVAFTSI